ncbi:MAG: arginase family protein [Oscillospiraceae bacterium]|nr:arginase family protein [Oscillospiraceae bacterium]
MEPETIILNFTDIYEEENFYQNEKFTWINCTDIPGTCCYCTPQAAEELRHRLKDHSAYGIHFLDSGDYHYVTGLWLEKIQEPFHLLLFDYHSDMQPPRFPGLFSCGGWVKDVMDHHPFLQNVCIVGPDQSAFAQISEKYRSRLICISLQALQEKETWGQLEKLKTGMPVYISIDKDVMSRYFACTDWSQGQLSLQVLEKLLQIFESHCRILGIDICGECKADMLPFLLQRAEKTNSDTNLALLRFLLRGKNR